MSNFEQIQAIATPIEIQLRWSDQDINGHINNVNILMLVEEARIQATQQWTQTTPGVDGTRRVTRALNTDFNREVHYGKETIVWVWIVRVGQTSFVFGQLLEQDGVPCVYAEATMVRLDADTGKPKPHDEAYRRLLETHVGPAYDPKA